MSSGVAVFVHDIVVEASLKVVFVQRTSTLLLTLITRPARFTLKAGCKQVH